MMSSCVPLSRLSSVCYSSFPRACCHPHPPFIAAAAELWWEAWWCVDTFPTLFFYLFYFFFCAILLAKPHRCPLVTRP